MTWVLLALLSAFFAALVAVFGKLGLQTVDTTLATTLRSVVMASFLILTTFFLGKAKLIFSLPQKAILFIVLAGIAGALSWLFYFFALKQGPATGVAALDRTSVVFVIVLAALFLGEGLTWKSILGGILIVGGAILLTIK